VISIPAFAMQGLSEKKFQSGWFKKTSNKSEAFKLADSVHLLYMKKFQNLFPDTIFIREKFFAFSKSLIAYKK